MRSRVARAFALTGYFSLLAVVLAWHVWLYPSTRLPVSLVLMFTAVPLLVPLRGVLHGRPRAHLWAALLSLAYFVHGVGETMANPAERWLGLAEVGSSLLLFFSATLFARWAGAHRRGEIGGGT